VSVGDSRRCRPRWRPLAPALSLLLAACASAHHGPRHVDLTWLSVTNVLFDLDTTGILADGYVTRLPRDAFHGGNGLAQTSRAFTPDTAMVRRVFTALGGSGRVDLLLTGHSHFDHSFDTATWSRLTGAPIMGSRTTCLQAEAQAIPSDRCTPVSGGERLVVAPGVTMHVVRWNHSGDSRVNPEQHDPTELSAAPTPDPATGGLHPGLAEDFPNGGGSRAFLFVVDGPEGRFSWFFQNSASAVDLESPIVVGGVNHGIPLENLRAAMRAARLVSVDLWIGSASTAVARLVLPVLHPRAFLPVHWDDFWEAFLAGTSQPWSDPSLERLLSAQGIRVVRPAQYMDKWRLDVHGVRPMPNDGEKAALGFPAGTRPGG
jgi:hypothetical protein